MKIVLAPNALKGSLTASQAGEAMRAGIHDALPEAEVRIIPVADGGDGLVDTLATPLSAELHQCTVSGPLGTSTEATFIYCPDKQLAVIEMATASGLALLPESELDAMAASSYGTGELISAALDLGCKHIVLGIGGSATTDGGTGLATALGMRFLDDEGNPLIGNGAQLAKICHIDRSGVDARLTSVRFDVACDVDNSLLGEHGAANIYAPQKGANPSQVEQLEQGLANLAEVIKHDTGKDVRHDAGSGAAGGMAAGPMAFFGATLKPGAQLVLELLGLEAAIEDADLVLTCEGRLDHQTRFGKAPAAVAKLAHKHGVPCVAIAGTLDDSACSLADIGFDAVFSLCPGPVSLEEAIKNADRYLQNTTQQVIRCQQLPTNREIRCRE